MLKPDQVKEITSIKDEDITKELMIRLFGSSDPKAAPRYKPTDQFELKKGMISNYTDSGSIITTVGRFIFNIFLNVGCFGNTFPYFNEPNIAKFNKQIDYALLSGKIRTDPDVVTYQTKRAWFEYTLIELVVPGISVNMTKPNAELMKIKDELFKKYEKELAAGDITISSQIEKELLAHAKRIFKDDPALRLYTAGGKPSFGNNFKNMNIMVGPIPDLDRPGEFHISKSNYMEGIDKTEYHNFADQLIAGTYSRSVQTSEGGAATKEFQAALQTVKTNLDPNSDCGTLLYSVINVSKDILEEMYLWAYVIGNDGKLIQITPDNLDKFADKNIKIRDVKYCKDEIYCSKCAGGLYSKLGIENCGLGCAGIPVTIQQLSMKGMHDTTINVHDLEFEKYFIDD